MIDEFEKRKEDESMIERINKIFWEPNTIGETKMQRRICFHKNVERG